MLGYFLKLKNLLPYSCYKSFYDIPLENYYKNGKRILIMDLDNTLIPYDLEVADEQIRARLHELESLGFKIFICSNNHPDRVQKFCEEFSYPYMGHSVKPFPKCFKWVLKETNAKISEILCIGDQLITDVYGSTRLGIDTILVKPIKKKSEKWYTRLNRHNEQIVLKRMKKRYPSIYKEIMENHED